MFDNNNFVIDGQSGKISKIIDLENAIFEDLNLTLSKSNDQITISGDNNSETYQEIIRSIKYIKIKSANLDKTNLSKEIEITIIDQEQNQSIPYDLSLAIYLFYLSFCLVSETFPAGVEPATDEVEARSSIQLSYRNPIHLI